MFFFVNNKKGLKVQKTLPYVPLNAALIVEMFIYKLSAPPQNVHLSYVLCDYEDISCGSSRER